MKTLKEFISECGKKCKKLNAKTCFQKRAKMFHESMITESNIKLDIPVFDEEEDGFTEETWKTLELPKAKYVVYKDMYRGSMWHFAALDDMVVSLVFFQFDYEDFDPKKDILFYGDDYKKLIAEMLKKLIKFDITKYDSFDAAGEALAEKTGEDFDEYMTTDKIADRLYVLLEYYFDKDKPETMEFKTVEDIMQHYY